jgi:hypothetical protein
VGQLLALNTRGSVDPRWLTHSSGVLRALQLAEVKIYNSGGTAPVYNPTTNTWTSTSDDIFVGPARIQPVNSVNELADSYNPTFIKTVRVQIPAITTGETAIRPNDRMRVTACAANPSLTTFIYIVTDVLNSSNAWERTLLCKVDTELDPTVIGS